VSRTVLLSIGAILLAMVTGCGGGSGHHSNSSAATTTSLHNIAAHVTGTVVPGVGTVSQAHCSKRSGLPFCLVTTDKGLGAVCRVATSPNGPGLYCGRAVNVVKTPCSLLKQASRVEGLASKNATGCVRASVADKLPPGQGH
jgi:hypothetical protein